MSGANGGHEARPLKAHSTSGTFSLTAGPRGSSQCARKSYFNYGLNRRHGGRGSPFLTVLSGLRGSNNTTAWTGFNAGHGSWLSSSTLLSFFHGVRDLMHCNRPALRFGLTARTRALRYGYTVRACVDSMNSGAYTVIFRTP